jgi:hypothetical protein
LTGGKADADDQGDQRVAGPWGGIGAFSGSLS